MLLCSIPSCRIAVNEYILALSKTHTWMESDGSLPDRSVQRCQEDRHRAPTVTPPHPQGTALQPSCQPPWRCWQFWGTVVKTGGRRSINNVTNFRKYCARFSIYVCPEPQTYPCGVALLTIAKHVSLQENVVTENRSKSEHLQNPARTALPGPEYISLWRIRW